MLSLVKLQEVCSPMSQVQQEDFIASLQAACAVEDAGVECSKTTFPPLVYEVRSSEPFISLDIDIEMLVYNTFRTLVFV